MPRLGDLYPRFEPAMRALGREGFISEQDLLTPRFLLERDDRFAIYYAPLDWLRPTARVAIVGITPGKDTMLRTYRTRTVASGLATGRAARSVLNDAKDNSFSGFRTQLVGWLDWLGLRASSVFRARRLCGHLRLATSSTPRALSDTQLLSEARTTGALKRC